MGRGTGAPWGTGYRLGVEVDQDLPDPCRRGPLRGPCPQRAPGGQFGSRGRQRSVAGLRTGSPSSGLRVRPGAAAAIREHDRGRAQPFDLAVGDASDEDPRRAQALADIAVIALLQHGVAGAPWRRKPSVSRALQARSVIEGAPRESSRRAETSVWTRPTSDCGATRPAAAPHLPRLPSNRWADSWQATHPGRVRRTGVPRARRVRTGASVPARSPGPRFSAGGADCPLRHGLLREHHPEAGVSRPARHPGLRPTSGRCPPGPPRAVSRVREPTS